MVNITGAVQRPVYTGTAPSLPRAAGRLAPFPRPSIHTKGHSSLFPFSARASRLLVAPINSPPGSPVVQWERGAVEWRAPEPIGGAGGGGPSGCGWRAWLLTNEARCLGVGEGVVPFGGGMGCRPWGVGAAPLGAGLPSCWGWGLPPSGGGAVLWWGASLLGIPAPLPGTLSL